MENDRASCSNGDDHAEDETEYDAAGNLTFDGNKTYTYDVFNRLLKVGRAFKFKDAGVGGCSLQTGGTIAEYAYDRKGTHQGVA